LQWPSQETAFRWRATAATLAKIAHGAAKEGDRVRSLIMPLRSA
jgi:hypothetical protein